MTTRPVVSDPLDPVRRRLAAYVPSRMSEPGLVPAGVLVPLYVEAGEAYVLLTRRTEHVATHKGQISFPGGAVEPQDRDAMDAALREAYEELGIRPQDVEILGGLDDVTTRVSGFLIRPYVGRIPHPYPLRPTPEEIAEILGIPLRFFLDDRNLRVELVGEGTSRQALQFYDYGPHTVWGATARVIRNLVEILR